MKFELFFRWGEKQLVHAAPPHLSHSQCRLRLWLLGFAANLLEATRPYRLRRRRGTEGDLDATHSHFPSTVERRDPVLVA
jgi:hypothetical protein